jgi:hypothetical protein
MLIKNEVWQGEICAVEGGCEGGEIDNALYKILIYGNQL